MTAGKTTATGEQTATEQESRNPFVIANYRRWWTASVVAATGVGIQVVTVPLFVTARVSEDRRALAIAAALICQTLPATVLVLFGGVIADRVERRRILVRTYAVAATVSLLYVFLSAGDIRHVWPVFILGAVVGAAGAFAQPARQSMVPQMLGQAQLQNGIIMGTVAFMASAHFVGPMLGGLVADGAGLTAGFGLEVILLTAGAIVFSRIATDTPAPTGHSIRKDLAEGLRYARGSPAILGLLFLATLPPLFFIGPLSVTVVLMVQDVFAARDAFVGIFMGCFGAGVFAGSILMTLKPLPRRGLLLSTSVIWGGLIFVAYGLSNSIPLAMAALVAWGLGAALFINLVASLLQETAAKEMMGRVMSMNALAFSVAGPIGLAQAGILTSLLGPRETIVLNGAIVTVVGVFTGLFLRPVRSLR